MTCFKCNGKGHCASECGKDKEKSSDSPRPLRSRDPSPYPDRGRRSSPNQYLQLRRVNVDPDKLFGRPNQ